MLWLKVKKNRIFTGVFRASTLPGAYVISAATISIIGLDAPFDPQEMGYICIYLHRDQCPPRKRSKHLPKSGVPAGDQKG
jgi:hypothetical protein